MAAKYHSEKMHASYCTACAVASTSAHIASYMDIAMLMAMSILLCLRLILR